ncbi:MAG: hypothetical protein SNJ77_05820 [Cytophagales bacterium]
MSFSCAFVVISCSNEQRPNIENQFILSTFNIANLSGCGHVFRLVDEQNSKRIISFWKPSEEAFCVFEKFALYVKIDSGNTIKNIYLYSHHESDLTVEEQSKKLKISLSSGWNVFSPHELTDGLLLEFPKNISIGELLIETNEKPIQKSLNVNGFSTNTFDEFVGTNSFVDVPLGLTEPFGIVREYHDWPDWNEPEKDSIYLDISKSGFDFKNYYLNMSRLGKICVPVIQKSPYWLTGNKNQLAIPIEPGANQNETKSYERAALFFQKYVINFTDKSKGGLKWFENGNEPDKWWEGQDCYQTPEGYAAFSSAVIDGHQAKINSLSDISSQFNLVMAGMANPKIENLNALKYWIQKNRKNEWLWSALNFHEYSNASEFHTDKPIIGVHPEKGKIFNTAKDWVTFKEVNNLKCEVWVSEFGFDTEESPQKAPPTKRKSAELVQADWILRSYFIYAMAGVDRAIQYMIRDFGKSGLYATSGLYSNTLKNEAYIKPSWNYINQAVGILNGCYLDSFHVDSTKNIYHLVYKSKLKPLKVHVLWLGTHNDSEVGINIDDLGLSENHQLYELSPDKQCPSKAILDDKKIKVSETPIFIQEGQEDMFNKCYSLEVLDNSNYSLKNFSKLNIPNLNDEPQTGNPILGIGVKDAVTFWSPGYNDKANETIFCEFEDSFLVHSISIFDGKGDGVIEIYGSKDSKGFEKIGEMNMRLYNKWQSIAINKNVKVIKLHFASGKPEIGELKINVKKL